MTTPQNILQSGSITPTHLARWTTIGVMSDGGTGGSWRGNWTATTQYFYLDFVVDASTGNIYTATANFVSSSTLAADVTAGNLILAINVVTIASGIQSAPTPNAQTGTTYTIQNSDNLGIVTISNGSAITVTLPASLTAGFNCLVEQEGAGQITFVAGSGATVQSAGGALKTGAQYSTAGIYVISNSGANAAWRVTGDIST